jgi:hypothetical protein
MFGAVRIVEGWGKEVINKDSSERCTNPMSLW